MEVFLQFLKDHFGEVALAFGSLSLVLSALFGGRSKNFVAMEDIIMKAVKKIYKTEETYTEPAEEVNAEGVPVYADNFQPVYKLNKATGKLEKTDELIDIQELINSARNVALNVALERLMPSTETDTVGEQLNELSDDLDILSEAYETAEQYREKLGLADTASIQDIFAGMQKHKVALQNKIMSATEKKEVKENEKNA